MSTISKKPVYNLKVVVSETGIKPDTLRAWERRYGLPEPPRTAGGHRLYSDYDIATIKWLLARQEEGMSIGRAVEIWRDLLAQGQEPLATSRIPVDTPPASPTELRDGWVAACEQFDEPGAEQLLQQAFALYPPEIVCVQVLQAGLAQIGQRWYAGRTTVQQEHFASALAMKRLYALLAAAPAPTRSGRILVCCAPQEEHSFPALLLTLLLRLRGWELVFLGANVPLAELENSINHIEPDLVILTAQQLFTAATLLTVAETLQAQAVPMAYGGMIFNQLPALRSRIPAHFLGETIVEAMQIAVVLLQNKLAVPEVATVSAVYRTALEEYRRQQAAVEAEIWSQIATVQLPDEMIARSNSYLARDIQAALTLGDMSFLDEEVAWLTQLLANHNLGQADLWRYFRAYHTAAKTVFGSDEHVVVSWLGKVVRSA
jgi:DNA-binding transcriptional MerR regulator